MLMSVTYADCRPTLLPGGRKRPENDIVRHHKLLSKCSLGAMASWVYRNAFWYSVNIYLTKRYKSLKQQYMYEISLLGYPI